MYTNEEKLKAAYAFNLCMVSVSQIVDYNDIAVLCQERDNILKNLNFENIIHDENVKDAFDVILETIDDWNLSEKDKEWLDIEYQHKVKNAVWASIPRLGMIFASGNPVSMALTLASQVGIGYMNYRRNKSDYQHEKDKGYWQIDRGRLEQCKGLQRRLFTTAWNLETKYEFPDEYRLSDEEISAYNNALTESDLIRKYILYAQQTITSLFQKLAQISQQDNHV